MTVLTSALMAGTSLVWDKEFGFLKEVLVAPVSPVAPAASVYPVPPVSIERSLKVATPPTAVAVSVPLSRATPVLGSVPIAMVTVFVAVETRVPLAS